MIYQPMETKTYETGEDIISAGHARRQALMGGRQQPINIAERKSLGDEISNLHKEIIALRTENRDLRRQLDEKLDIISSHEQAINLLTNSDDEITGRRPVKEIVISALEDFPGVSYAQVIGPSRSAQIVEARHTCVYSVHKARPDLSLPQIGKLFGGRDHTSILHCIRKMEARFNG